MKAKTIIRGMKGKKRQKKARNRTLEVNSKMSAMILMEASGS